MNEPNGCTDAPAESSGAQLQIPREKLPQSSGAGLWGRLRHDLHRMRTAGVFHMLVLTVGTRGMSLVQQVLIVRILEKAVFGQAVYMLRFAAPLAVLAGLGLGAGVRKYCSEPIDDERRRAIYRAGMLSALFSGIITAIIYAAVIYLLGSDRVYLHGPMLALSLYLPIVAVAAIPPLLLQALKRFSTISRISLACTAIRVSLIVLLSYLYGLWGFLTAVIIGTALPGIVFTAVTRDWLRPNPKTGHELRRLLHFGFFAMIANFLGAACRSAPVLLLKWLGRTDEDVATYGVALFVYLTVMILPESLRQTAFPHLSRLLNQPARMKLRIMELIRKQAVAMSLIVLAFAAVGYWMVPLVFGADYRASYLPALILLVALTVSSLNGGFSMALIALDMVRVNAAIAFVRIVVMVGLSLVLIPRWGILGAVCAQLIVELMLVTIRRAVAMRILNRRIETVELMSDTHLD